MGPWAAVVHDRKGGERSPAAWSVPDIGVDVAFQLADPQSLVAEPIARQGTLVLVDEQGRRVAFLAITFTSRATSGTAALLAGSDATGGLGLEVSIRLDPPGMGLRLHFELARRTSARELLPVLAFLRALHPSRRLGLLSPDGRLVGDPSPVPASTSGTPPDDFSECVRALAVVETLTSTRFDVPLRFEDDDVVQILSAERLLRGETIIGSWSVAELGLEDGAALPTEVVGGGQVFAFEFTLDAEAEILGRHVPLGRASQRLLQARVGGEANGEPVRLVPADDDRYELRLLEAPEIDPYDSLLAEPVVIGDFVQRPAAVG